MLPRQNAVGNAQVVPHWPQCWAFTAVLTHSPSQSVSLPLHLSPPPSSHLPSLHVAPAAHAIRQPPQWAALVSGLTHAPSQVIWPVGQRAAQVPLRQTCVSPVPQAVSLGRLVHAQALAAVQVRQGAPAQLSAQQREPTHEPD